MSKRLVVAAAAGLAAVLGAASRAERAQEPPSLQWRASSLQTLRDYCAPSGGGARVGCDYEKILLEVRGAAGGPKRQYVIHYYPDENLARLSPADLANPKNRRPLVLLAPIPGFVVSMNWYCMSVAQRGMNCAYVEVPHDTTWVVDYEKALEEMPRFRSNILETVQGVQLSVDYLLNRPEVDPDRVGVLGCSLGGITGSLLAQRDRRIKSLVLLISGAGFPDILLNTRLPEFLKFRDSLIKAQDLRDEAALRRFMEEQFGPIDPIHGVERMKGLPVLMVNFSADPVFPRISSDLYARALERSGARVTYRMLEIEGHNMSHFFFNFPALFRTLDAFTSSIGFLEGTLR